MTHEYTSGLIVGIAIGVSVGLIFAFMLFPAIEAVMARLRRELAPERHRPGGR